MENLTVDITLANEKVQFKSVSDLHPDYPIQFDYTAPLGDDDGFLGLEMFLMSFAGCVSTAVVCLLRRTGKNIESYTAKTTGIRNERPLFLKQIIFEIAVKSNGISAEEMENALQQAEEISPVWLAIKNNVLVTTNYKLI